MENSKLKSQLQTEIDTAFLYKSIAAIQTDENLNRVLIALAHIEEGHAQHMLREIQKEIPAYAFPKPSSRAKIQLRLGKVVYRELKNSLPSIPLKTNSKQVKNYRDLNTIT
jgi:hypothetical protein